MYRIVADHKVIHSYKRFDGLFNRLCAMAEEGTIQSIVVCEEDNQYRQPVTFSKSDYGYGWSVSVWNPIPKNDDTFGGCAGWSKLHYGMKEGN